MTGESWLVGWQFGETHNQTNKQKSFYDRLCLLQGLRLHMYKTYLKATLGLLACNLVEFASCCEKVNRLKSLQCIE